MTPNELSQWRQQHGFTLVMAAEALGSHRNSIAIWEAGKRPIPKYIGLACVAVTLGYDQYVVARPTEK